MGEVLGEGAAPRPGLTAAAGTVASVRSPQAAAETAATASEAWVRSLPPDVRKGVDTVKELVLPLKKLKLLADIDAHLYNFSNSACWQLREPCKQNLVICGGKPPCHVQQRACFNGTMHLLFSCGIVLRRAYLLRACVCLVGLPSVAA